MGPLSEDLDPATENRGNFLQTVFDGRHHQWYRSGLGRQLWDSAVTDANLQESDVSQYPIEDVRPALPT